jgi:hypothetical protein
MTGTIALAGGEAFLIVNNNGNDEIIGTFIGLPEASVIPNFLNSNLNATISYIGGTGNDVVLTVNNPALAFHPDDVMAGEESITTHTRATYANPDDFNTGHTQTAVECPQISFPNPQHRYSYLQFSETHVEDLNILIMDIQGRKIVELENYADNWSMSGLKSGIYIFHLTYSNSQNQRCTETGKLVIFD